MTNEKRKIYILIVLLIIILIIFFFSGYRLIVWNLENIESRNNIDIIIKETKEKIIDGEVVVDYSSIFDQNDEIVGWIKIENTNINYPVVKHTDNKYYLNHSLDKSKNGAGWIFMDYNNNGRYLDSNNIIYGHNRKDGSMFGTLKNVLKKDWINNQDNLIIKYNTIDNLYNFKIFSVYYVTNEDDYTKTYLSDELIKKFIDRSIYKLDNNITINDKILTLQTCSGSRKKLIVHAVLMEK